MGTPLHIFVSWSGARSKAMAKALCKWLPEMFEEAIAPWMSDDTEAGQFWNRVISDNLESTRFGIVCVTSDNQASPWLNFEAGACAKLFRDSRAVPFLLDITPTELKPPLAQLQAKCADSEGCWGLVETINKFVDPPKPAERMRRKFERYYADLSHALKKIAPPTAAPAKRDPNDILGEILTLVRQIDSNVNADHRSTVEPSSEPNERRGSTVPKPWSATDFTTFQEKRRKSGSTPSDGGWTANESTAKGAVDARPRVAQRLDDVEEDTIDETGGDREHRVHQVPADRPAGD